MWCVWSTLYEGERGELIVEYMGVTREVYARKAPMHARGEVFTSRECHLPWFVVIAVQGVLRRRKVKSAGGVAVCETKITRAQHGARNGSAEVAPRAFSIECAARVVAASLPAVYSLLGGPQYTQPVENRPQKI